MIIDECVTFMIAGTQTTAALVYNASYYLITNPKIKQKLRAELAGFNSKSTEESFQEIEWL